MTSQDARNEIKTKLLSELVQQVCGLKDDDVKTYRLVQTAWAIIRKHRSTSTNSYHVRRRIDEMKEKFVICNYSKFADHLERLCNEVINHPLCVQHEEVDIQWSLLDLLFSLAYNPTGALQLNQSKINLDIPEKICDSPLAHLEELYFKNELKKDFIPLQNYDSDSDLSDWSDQEDVHEKTTSKKIVEQSTKESIQNKLIETIILPGLPSLEPPKRPQYYTVKIVDFQLKKRLQDSVQNLWWIPKAMQIIDQEIATTNTCFFAECLGDLANIQPLRLQAFRDPSITTEFRLLRELLWALHSPQKCTFFIIKNDEIKLCRNVTIPSVSAPTLAIFVESRILPYLNNIYKLRCFLMDVYACQDRTLSTTYEHYAANLKKLIDPILNELLEYEHCLVQQEDFIVNSLISFYEKSLNAFRQIESIYAIHEAVILDFKKYPSYICSTYLIAALLYCAVHATKPMDSNLAMSLFLTSIKAFCSIIDSWWNEGRLDDWQEEFLVESNSDQKISLRPFSKNNETSFFIPQYITKTIQENVFVQLILEHSVEAGYTLNLLYEISRIGDLRNSCKTIEGNLYDNFLDDMINNVKKLTYSASKIDESFQNYNEDVVDTTSPKSLQTSTKLNLSTKDEFLLSLFNQTISCNESNINESDDVCDASCRKERLSNSLEIFKELEKYQENLPMEEIVLESFSHILKERIKLANMFVVKLYLEDINILQHLRNIRKVLLLESNDLMQEFYLKLFYEVENGQSWANAFVLTMQLDDIISSMYPEMTSLFRIEIDSAARSKTNKATEAVEAIILRYSLSNELSKIITPEDMRTYNEIFRFLVKVKWGLATLESLKFSPARQRRLPYASLELAEFLMRRLELLRLWMFYGIQCIHSHLMTHVLQSMGTQLDEKINQCTNVREMQKVHSSYLQTIAEHCFLNENLNKIKLGIEQTLNLVFVLRSEWRSCLKYIEECHPLAIDDSIGSQESEQEDYVITADIDQVELTYIRCHQYLANMLNNEVYLNHKHFLSGLSAAFNTSLPC